MTTDKKPREFWIIEGPFGNTVDFMARDPWDKHTVTHVREIIPDEISDTDRLNRMIEEQAFIAGPHSVDEKYEVQGANSGYAGRGETPREAIDDCIRKMREAE